MKQILLTLFIILALILPPSDATGEVRVTITFVAGGIVGGVSLFIYIASGGRSNLLVDEGGAKAFLNYGSDGWNLSYPSLAFADAGENDPIPYLQIINVRF